MAMNLGALALAAPARAAPACGRACLYRVLDGYLHALAARSPSAAPMAAGYRATEDGKPVRLGDGVWATVTGLGAYRVDLADPRNGNVGHIGELIEGQRRTPFALRLKVSGGKVTESEIIVGRGRVPGAGVEPRPRPSLARIVPSRRRIPRDRMIATADANFDAILAADGRLYADDCQRIENRMAMSGTPRLDYPIAAIPGKPKPAFGAMGCRQQIEAHLFDALDEVSPRRFVVVDEEKQQVLSIVMMKWWKKGRCNDIPNYGRICPTTPRKPAALLNAELLGVRGGQIHEIEAVFQFVDYDADSGWPSVSEPCARACLVGALDQYLQAVRERSPDRLSLAGGFRYTENGAALKPGQGLWATVTGYSPYRIVAADPTAGQVAVIGEAIEGERRVMFATRLKLEGGRIAEAETVIGRSFSPSSPSMPTRPRAGLTSPAPAERRISRRRMTEVVRRNFDNLLRNDGSHFAPDCQRIENRMPMSGNPELSYPITPIPGKPMPAFGAMGCREQVEAHLFDTLDAVDPRRILVVDEEQQVVFGVFSLRFYGRTACNDIPGYGRTCPARNQPPISLLSAEMLGVRDGRLHEVEVVFTRMPYEASQGWEGGG